MFYDFALEKYRNFSKPLFAKILENIFISSCQCEFLYFTKKPFPIYYYSLLEINTRRTLSKFKNPLKNFTAKRCLKWLIKKYFKEEIYFNTLVLRKLRKQNF